MSTKQNSDSGDSKKPPLARAIDKALQYPPVKAVLDLPPVKMATKTLKAVGDETFFNWLAHGSTELANMVLHGHAAPVYSHGSSPAQGSPTEQQAVQPVDSDIAHDQSIAPGSANVLDKYLPNNTEVAATQEQAMVTSHGAPDSKSLAIVEQHMQDVAAMPDLQTPEQELSR